LSRGVQVTSAAWQAVMRIVSKVEDLVQRIGDGPAQVRYSVAGQSGDQVTLRVVCTVDNEMISVGFLV
jgi:hypothetical protein